LPCHGRSSLALPTLMNSEEENVLSHMVRNIQFLA
jgi:hypothetical protein